MKRVMVSGYYDPLTDAGLDYLEQAIKLEPDILICVVGSDEQLMMKKNKVNMPEESRAKIVSLILKGLGVKYCVMINRFDKNTTLIAQALELIQPDILFRGGDKNIDMMPLAERNVCERLHIEIKHGEFRIDRHGSRMVL